MVDDTPQSLMLYRIDPARNMRRYYRLELQQDLLGQWLLTREWGRIGCRGQTRLVSFDCFTDAYQSLIACENDKRHRGYQPSVQAARMAHIATKNIPEPPISSA